MESTQDAPHEETTRPRRLACDGQSLKRLAAAGLAWLEHNYPKIDALNVFPVPDGDTGTNMLLTMRSAYNEVAHETSTDVGAVAHGLAHGALMGARGNSGVILSQLWRGFARKIDGAAHLDCATVAAGLREATETAYKGVIRPVEGTILTVSREIAEEAEAACAADADLMTLLERVVARAHAVVERTPDMLPVLKKAGVVDFGGMGLTVLLEGMLMSLQGRAFELPGAVAVRALPGVAGHPVPAEGLHFPYDVQFLLRGTDLDVEQVREVINAMGDSTLVVGDARAIKVHVHVLDPGAPLSYAVSHGSVSDVVVENMRDQYEVYARTQAAASLPEVEVQPGDIAVVAVVSGDGLTRVFKSLGVAHIVHGGQTMNPSTEELLGAIHNLPTDRIAILPNNKNILMAAQQAAEMAHGQGIDARVVPTVTIPQGISALMALNPQGDFDAIVEAMNAARANVATAEITTATRSVEIDGVVARAGQIIGLIDGNLAHAGDDLDSVILALLDQMGVDERELITLYYGNGVTAEQAETLAERVRAHFAGLVIEVVQGGQPHYHYILSAE